MFLFKYQQHLERYEAGCRVKREASQLLSFQQCLLTEKVRDFDLIPFIGDV